MYVVDDDAVVRHSLQALLDVVAGVKSIGFPSGEALLAGADSLQAGCILLDHRLSGMNGLAVLGAIQARKLPLVVILTGGDIDDITAASAVQMGAVAVLTKPFPRTALAEALADARLRLDGQRAANG